MGSSLNIKCRNCDYSLEVLIGIGMLYWRVGYIEDREGRRFLRELLQSEAEFKRVKAMIRHCGIDTLNEYGHWLYRCNVCGHLCNKFYLRIRSGELSYSPQYPCPACNNTLQPVQEEILMAGFDEELIDLSQIPCPKCKSHALSKDETQCLWD